MFSKCTDNEVIRRRVAKKGKDGGKEKTNVDLNICSLLTSKAG